MYERIKEIREGLESKLNSIDNGLSEALNIYKTFGNNLDRLDSGDFALITDNILQFLPRAKASITDVLNDKNGLIYPKNINKLLTIAKEADNLNRAIGKSKNREDWNLSEQENIFYSIIRNNVCYLTQLGEWAVELRDL